MTDSVSDFFRDMDANSKNSGILKKGKIKNSDEKISSLASNLHDSVLGEIEIEADASIHNLAKDEGESTEKSNFESMGFLFDAEGNSQEVEEKNAGELDLLAEAKKIDYEVTKGVDGFFKQIGNQNTAQYKNPFQERPGTSAPPRFRQTSKHSTQDHGFARDAQGSKTRPNLAITQKLLDEMQEMEKLEFVNIADLSEKDIITELETFIFQTGDALFLSKKLALIVDYIFSILEELVFLHKQSQIQSPVLLKGLESALARWNQLEKAREFVNLNESSFLDKDKQKTIKVFANFLLNIYKYRNT